MKRASKRLFLLITSVQHFLNFLILFHIFTYSNIVFILVARG